MSRLLQLDEDTGEWDVPHGDGGLISIGGALATFNGLDTKLEARARMLREIEADVARQRKLTTEIAKIGANISAVIQAIENQRIPQPHLEALGVVALGALWAGRRVKTQTGHLASSILLGISPSGSGKDSAHSFVSACAIAQPGHREPGEPVRAPQVVPSTFSSVQSFVKAIADHSHDGLTVFFTGEEVGKNFAELFAKTAAPSRREVATALLELVPMPATKPFRRQTSISGGGGEIIELQSPAVTVYGTSTGVALRAMLQSDASKDGLLGRAIALNGLDRRNPENRGAIKATLTPTMLVLRKRASEAHTAWQSGISYGRLIPEPMDVRYTPEALRRLDAICTEYGWRYNEAKGEVAKSIAARAYEKIERVALAFAVVEHVIDPTVTEQCVIAAEMLVELSHEVLESAALEASAGNDAEAGTPLAKCMAQIESILREADGEWVTKSEITTRVRRHGLPLREMAVDGLVESGVAEESTQIRGGRKTTLYRWAE